MEPIKPTRCFAESARQSHDPFERLWERFEKPDREFSPVPFWFINDRPSHREIERQLKDFLDHGIHAMVLHPRIGIPLDIPYLSDVFMGHITDAVETAAKLGMTVMLYDEGMYPSGSAGGLVARENPCYAARALVLESGDYQPGPHEEIILKKCARFDGNIIDQSTLSDYSSKNLPKDWRAFTLVHAPSRGSIRGIHFGTDSQDPGAPSAGDILNPDAVACFIRLTHERYYERLKTYFGTTITAIFTDEPSPLGRYPREGAWPFTYGFATWLASKGFDQERLPLLWFDGEDAVETRKLYAELASERLIETFYKPLYQWCEVHSIALAGHPSESDDISPYRWMQIPGQDVVFRYVCPEKDSLESVHGVMAKATADIARQLGRKRNLNEALGCCYRGSDPWDLPFSDVKWILDYLFARGCNLVILHAFFYSVNNPGRYRERPPDVGPNSIWWPHYRQISRYIACLSFLNTGRLLPQVFISCADGRIPAGEVKSLYQTQRGFSYFDPELGSPEGPLYDGCVELVPRDLETDRYVPDLRVSRMEMDGIRYFLLFNEGETPLEFSFPSDGTDYELWLPWQGKRYRTLTDCDRIHIALEMRQSAVLVPMSRSALPLSPHESPMSPPAFPPEPWWEETPIRNFPLVDDI